MSKIAIIGSGMGGLIAGNLLANKGHDVTIFESHTSPGGYTSGFWKKGFYFESGTLSFELSETVFRTMKKIGVYEEIPFIRQHGRWIFRDLDCVIRSYGEFKKALLEAFPDEKENLYRYFADVDRMYASLLALYRNRTIFDLVGYPFKLARGLKLFKKYDGMTVPEFTANYFKQDSPVYRILKNVGYPDMGASILGGAAFTFFDDYWTVKTGMQSWADTLVRNFVLLGGELRLGTTIERILTRKGAAVGVLGAGKEFYADYIVSASDYKKTFLELLDDKTLVPSEARSKMRDAPVSESFFTVYLGLDLPREKMVEGLKIPHVYYNEDAQDVDIHDSADRRYFEKSWLVFYSPSLMNPDLAPQGQSSLMIQAMSPPRWMDNWGGGDRILYRRLKEKVKNILIKRASVLLPDIKNHVVYAEAATPLTYERFTNNTGGASSAWSWNPRERYHDSILDVEIKTPVKNLFIGSCWATQLGGIPGSLHAAEACAKKIRQVRISRRPTIR